MFAGGGLEADGVGDAGADVVGFERRSVEVNDVADVLRNDRIGGIQLEGFGESRMDNIVLAEDACFLRLLDEIGDEVRFGNDDGVLVVRIGGIELRGFAEGVVSGAGIVLLDGMRAGEIRLGCGALVVLGRRGGLRQSVPAWTA